ncbi:hypothetical protein KY362_01760 [Candidatus Woesearchaeota archaeon]|nr:hypothetical protein [Candidatus Woesearchaeota archaeon]
MGFKQTVQDIKSLKIQGAENVAKEAVKSLLYVVKQNKNPPRLSGELANAKAELFKTRATEPCMRNALNYVLQDSDAALVKKRVGEVLGFFKDSKEKIVEYGQQKIKDGNVVYTHCHSGTVTGVIIAAAKQGKHVEVHNTETRPRFQGRVTSTELAKAGIPVVHYVDAAARFALKKADIMLIGADAITSEGKVINKVGSELIAEAASHYGVPVYVCTNSWKFDPETVFGFEEPIEKRFAGEVWEKPPCGVRIDNFAFEQVDPKLISGVVTELGVFKPQALVTVMQKKYGWMFGR